jgi:antitoxin (DNA-binding transcriptional repressor) of toxin-antitoxin stability system
VRTAQVSELKDRLDELIDAVKNGETVEIWEGHRTVASLVPQAARPEPEPFPDDFFTRPLPKAKENVVEQLLEDRGDQSRLREHMEELIRQGKAHRGTGQLPDDFFTRPRPKLEGGSVLEQLLRDREED